MGYLANLGRPQAADAKKKAEIAEAVAQEESEKKRIAVAESIAVANRELDLRRASIQAETDKARASADAAEPLEVAEQQQQILIQQELVEAKRAQVTERTLEVEVRRPADAERYRVEQLAESNKNATIAAADARRQESIAQAQAKAEADRLNGEGRLALAEAQAKSDESEARGKLALATTAAEAVRLNGEAVAEAIKAKALAEAEGMEKKADAYKNYGEAAILESVMNMLPAVAREFAAPMGNIDTLTVIDSNGANKLSQGVAENMATLPTLIGNMTGLDINGLISGFLSKSETDTVQLTAKKDS